MTKNEDLENNEELPIEEQLALLNEETSDKTDRYYAKKHKKLYNNVRKGLVLIAKARNKTINNHRAYKLSVELLKHNLADELKEQESTQD